MSDSAFPLSPSPGLARVLKGQASSVARSSAFSSFLVAILFSVLFTPAVRLGGRIPVRIDDLLAFAVGAVLLMSCIARARIPRPCSISIYLGLLAATILISTLMASMSLGVMITSKEYLDLLRPLKFLIVYWAVRELPGRVSMHTFVRVFFLSISVLLAVAFLEMLLARFWPGGPFTRLFAHFADNSWSQGDAELSMLQRPFATFNTPTHLGYVATLGFFLAPVLSTRTQRRWFATVSFLALLVSATRTLLFGLPLLFAVQAFARGGSLGQRLCRLRSAFALSVLAGLFVALLLPVLSPHAADFTGSMVQSVTSGNTQDDYSISTRLNNLALVAYTWRRAPILGVATRSLLPDYVDSELILTFHRYGSLGLFMLFALYPLSLRLARRVPSAYQDFSVFAIVSMSATFLYGITQGALVNSRMGVLPFVILGVLASLQRGAQLSAVSHPATFPRFKDLPHA